MGPKKKGVQRKSISTPKEVRRSTRVRKPSQKGKDFSPKLLLSNSNIGIGLDPEKKVDDSTVEEVEIILGEIITASVEAVDSVTPNDHGITLNSEVSGGFLDYREVYINVDEDILDNKDSSSPSNNSLLNFFDELNVSTNGNQGKLQECASELSSMFKELKIHPQPANIDSPYANIECHSCDEKDLLLINCTGEMDQVKKSMKKIALDLFDKEELVRRFEEEVVALKKEIQRLQIYKYKLFELEVAAENQSKQIEALEIETNQKVTILEKQNNVLQEDNIFLRSESTKIKNENKVSSNDLHDSSITNSQCSCCEMTEQKHLSLKEELSVLRGYVTDEINSIKEQMKENDPSPDFIITAPLPINSTVLSSASSASNKDVTEELVFELTTSVSNIEVIEKQPLFELPELPLDTYKIEFEWEKHSSGVARKSLQKMGYHGGGLGKHEDGIQDALSVECKEKTFVVSSSITKGINPYGFNKGYSKGEAMFQRFHGGKVRHIKNYLPTHLDDEHPDNVIIVAGGNDISSLLNGKLSSVDTVVDDIIECGNICKNHGVKRVYVSSILPRQSFFYQIQRKKVNDVLRRRCRACGFIFIENDNIIMKDHVTSDGVHLNVSGSRLLCRNILQCLNKKY